MELMIIDPGIISAPYDNFKKYCAHFKCKLIKRRGQYFITSEDSTNFFWLGMNMNFHSESRLCETPADKYLTSKKQ